MLKELEIIENKYYNMAIQKKDENKLTECLEYLKKVIEINSKNKDALNLLGLIYYIFCEFSQSKYFWQKSIMVDNENNIAKEYLENIASDEFNIMLSKYNKGIESISDNRLDEVEKIFMEISFSNSSLIEVQMILGLCKLYNKKYDKAIEDFTKIKKIDRENISAREYINQISTLKLKNIRNYSRNIFLSGIILFVITTVVIYNNFNNKVEKKNENNKKTEIVSAKNEEIEFDKKMKYSLKESLKLLKEKKENEAIIALKDIVEYSSEKNIVGESIFFLAQIYDNKKEYKTAINYYQKYFEGFKGSNYYDDVLYRMGIIYFEAGYKKEAIIKFSELKKKYTNSIFYNSKVRYILSQNREGTE